MGHIMIEKLVVLWRGVKLVIQIGIRLQVHEALNIRVMFVFFQKIL